MEKSSGEIVWWVVDASMDAKKGSGCQFLTRQVWNSHVLWEVRICKLRRKFGQNSENTMLHVYL